MALNASLGQLEIPREPAGGILRRPGCEAFVMTVYLPIEGSQQQLLPASQPLGPVDLDEISSVTVRLRSRGDPQKLISNAYELACQPLARRQYLTHQDLADRHGA